jgi:hypothetical protein
MKKFRRDASGMLTARFEAREAELLRRLARDTTQILTASRGPIIEKEDPALKRLLPDAYPDDPEASAEFRRFTADGLAERKIRNSKSLIDGLGENAGVRVSVVLDDQAAQAWLRTLTDIRLILAARLGIERDGDVGFRGTADSFRRSIEYQWVGYVQESLIRALNAQPKQ